MCEGGDKKIIRLEYFFSLSKKSDNSSLNNAFYLKEMLVRRNFGIQQISVTL